jgi:hypothetical protein
MAQRQNPANSSLVDILRTAHAREVSNGVSSARTYIQPG